MDAERGVRHRDVSVSADPHDLMGGKDTYMERSTRWRTSSERTKAAVPVCRSFALVDSNERERGQWSSQL